MTHTDKPYCPQCGKKRGVQMLDTVFIEDGPWDGKNYANEGDFSRFRCECGAVFGWMPTPLKCSACSGDVYGEVGEDCEEVEGREGEAMYLCRYCMKVAEEAAQ